MVAWMLYLAAVVVLAAGIFRAVFADSRPCGMDDILSSCGSGARYGTLIGAIVTSLILSYIGRALHREK